ncbi:biotin carboxylase [Colwellia psychrerythraea]|uniref:Biotin carboxylase n=1 Tax=Colwellia psychrerythraea TaxID=28229 RepID=A0A1Y5EP30_COLPS|nr:biotin carboxylase [Colwellia psychrerythraea]
MKKLNGLTDIYKFFRTYKKPIYFVSASPFNILGLGQLVPTLRYINYFDCFDGVHHRVFTPKDRIAPEFTCLEDVVNHLIKHQETNEYMAKREVGGHMLAVMFDQKTEQLVKDMGINMAMPSYELRNRLDSKIVTTQMANEAGVASVPNVLGHAESYQDLLTLAKPAKLGKDLVVQTPYGDSGKTTFFISSAKDWQQYEKLIIGQEIKVMKRIDPRCGTVEAVATKHGTIVGPILSELVGHKELTPYKGGWCGNEGFVNILNHSARTKLERMVKKFGERLYKEGYKGTFCIDYLIDKKDGRMYLGELNPRISGASPITNLLTQKYGGVPLLMFHLLEHMDIDYEINIKDIQKRWREYDTWSHVIFKHTGDDVRILNQVPRSGIWKTNKNNDVELVRRTADWSNVSSMDEAFFLRILGPGEYIYKGADMGVLLVRGHMQTKGDKLTPRAKNWVASMKAQFQSASLETDQHPMLNDEDILNKIF